MCAIIAIVTSGLCYERIENPMLNQWETPGQKEIITAGEKEFRVTEEIVG